MPRLEELLPAGLHSGWALRVGQEGLDLLAQIGARIDQNPGQKALLTPDPERIMRALTLPPENLKVLIIGQDPYPGVGHACGLAFSVDRHVRPLPPSLINIRSEYRSDTGLFLPDHGDISPWSKQGVLLLNRHLTTLIGSPGAHRRLGWGAFTDLVVRTLVAEQQFFVGILWGREAQELAPLLGSNPRIESAHPSPLSARRGFFGSQPFTRTNRYLEKHGHNPIDWSLEGEK